MRHPVVSTPVCEILDNNGFPPAAHIRQFGSFLRVPTSMLAPGYNDATLAAFWRCQHRRRRPAGTRRRQPPAHTSDLHVMTRPYKWSNLSAIAKPFFRAAATVTSASALLWQETRPALQKCIDESTFRCGRRLLLTRQRRDSAGNGRGVPVDSQQEHQDSTT
jgi:hypothetical protein